jgi:hypothetical protein
MTQPSGRVLGSPAQFRTYLRSSPILCLFDAIFFLLRLAVSPRVLQTRLSHAISLALAERYRHADELADGIRSLEQPTWLR